MCETDLSFVKYLLPIDFTKQIGQGIMNDRVSGIIVADEYRKKSRNDNPRSVVTEGLFPAILSAYGPSQKRKPLNGSNGKKPSAAVPPQTPPPIFPPLLMSGSMAQERAKKELDFLLGILKRRSEESENGKYIEMHWLRTKFREAQSRTKFSAAHLVTTFPELYDDEFAQEWLGILDGTKEGSSCGLYLEFAIAVLGSLALVPSTSERAWQASELGGDNMRSAQAMSLFPNKTARTLVDAALEKSSKSWEEILRELGEMGINTDLIQCKRRSFYAHIHNADNGYVSRGVLELVLCHINGGKISKDYIDWFNKTVTFSVAKKEQVFTI